MTIHWQISMSVISGIHHVHFGQLVRTLLEVTNVFVQVDSAVMDIKIAVVSLQRITYIALLLVVTYDVNLSNYVGDTRTCAQALPSCSYIL